MMGVFVQLNEGSRKAAGCPLGYVIQENGCWEWTGHKLPSGYAFWCSRYVHRMMYEQEKGPIPQGLHIDHLCRNRGCINPDHLEAVTCRENVLRGDTIAARHAAKTACPRGHPYSHTTRKGRQCRECKRTADRQRYLRAKEAL